MYIGLDVGTSSCKASVVNEKGEIVKVCQTEYSITFPRPDWVEIDPATVVAAVKEVLAGLSGVPDLKAMAIASFGEAAVLLDEHDRPLSGSIFYTDIRGTQEVDDLKGMFDPAWLFETTGMPISSIYSINKLLWVKKNQPALLERAKRVLLFEDYLGYVLTGEAAIDLSLASRTMALDIRKGQWVPEIWGAADIDVGKLSRPVPSGTVVGTLRPSLAAELGLPADLKLVTGGHDQVCAALGSGAVSPGRAVDGMGNSECVSLVMPDAFSSPAMMEQNYCCEPHCVPGRYVTLAFNNTSGASIKWFRDCFEGELAAECFRKGENVYGILDGRCSQEPSPLLFLPYLAGTGTPYMDSGATGILSGLRLSTRKEDIYRAVLEGLCYEMLFNLQNLERMGIQLGSRLRVAGGGSRSATLLQIKADILQKEIEVLSSSESGTIGLAMLCAVAMGDIPTLEEAADIMVQTAGSYTPSNKHLSLYQEKYQQYRRLYLAMNQIYRG